MTPSLCCALVHVQVMAYAGVSYPFSVSWALTLFHHSTFLSQAAAPKPKLFLMGTKDNFTGMGAFDRRVGALPGPIDVVTVKVRRRVGRE